MSEDSAKIELPQLRRRRRQNKWIWVLFPLVTIIVAFTLWQVVLVIQIAIKKSVHEEVEGMPSKKVGGQSMPVEPAASSVTKPATTLLNAMPGIKTYAPPPAAPKKETDAAKKAAAAAALKAAAVELEGKMKKDSDEAKAEVTEATAKDIGLRSEVKENFRIVARMMKEFLLARSESEIEPLIRRPFEVMPKYREWTTAVPVQPAAQFQINPKFITTDRYFLVGVPMGDGSSRLAAFEKLGKSTFRLDWESFAGWCESRFVGVSKLASNRQVLMRVNAQRSASIPPFPVKEGGLSFTLSHPDEQATLSAYLPAEVLTQGDKAARYLAGMQKRGMVTLKIYVDDECRTHGWAKIAAVPNVGWVSDLQMETGSTILSK